MEIVRVILDVFFLGILPLGMIVALVIAGVMALVGKKIKRGVWSGLCAFGMLQMIGLELLYNLWAGGGNWVVTLAYMLGTWVGCLCAAGFMMMAVSGKKKPGLVALLIPAMLYLFIVNMIDMVRTIADMVEYSYGFSEVLKAIFRIRWGELFLVVALILLAVWYLTGRKKLWGIIAMVLAALALIIGFAVGIRMACAIFGLDLRDVYRGGNICFIYTFSWTPSFCVLLVQMMQLGILSGKFDQGAAVAVPAGAEKEPLRAAPVTVAAPAAEEPADAPRFCANCGHKLPEVGSFCINCGMRI